MRVLDSFGNPWVTENGGKSWQQGLGGFSITQQETDQLLYPNHYEGGIPKWEGWETFLASFPSDKELHNRSAKNTFLASDPNNNQNQLLTVVIHNSKADGSTEYNSRLFLSQDGGKTWRELSAPPPSERGLRIGAIALISSGNNFKIYVALQQWR